LETTTLLEKQNLIRTREAAIWELERLQMEQRCNVIRKHVRDFFYLQRHLMLSKQEKDLEHLRQLNTKLEDDLIRRQNEEKRLFLKSLRQEQRSRREMYRRSLYIIPSNNQNVGNSSSNGDSFKMSADEEKRKLKEVFLAFIYHYDINFNKKIFSSLRKEKKKDLKMNCKD
jgi:STE20-like kinase